MENIEAIKTKAEQITTELAANDAANAAEHAAAVALLTRVIEIAKPAIRAVGDRAMVGCNKQGEWHDDERAILIGAGCRKKSDGYSWKFFGEYVQVKSSGITRRTYAGYGNAGGFTVKSSVVDVDLESTATSDVRDWISEVCDAVISAGSRADATKAALARAEKMKAIAALL